jgi:hypothetical protein
VHLPIYVNLTNVFPKMVLLTKEFTNFRSTSKSAKIVRLDIMIGIRILIFSHKFLMTYYFVYKKVLTIEFCQKKN